MMLYAGSFDTGAEVVAQFILIVSSEFMSEECCYLIRFDGVNSGSGDDIVERFRESGLIENMDFMRVKITCHPLGKSKTWKNPPDENPVIGGTDSTNLIGATLK